MRTRTAVAAVTAVLFLTQLIRAKSRTGSAAGTNAFYGTAPLPSRLVASEPGPCAPVGRGRRRTRRALGRRCTGRALRSLRARRLRAGGAHAPRQGARRGRDAGGVPRRLAQRTPVRAGARKGVDVDPDARPPARRRHRAARATPPRRRARACTGADRRRNGRERVVAAGA